MKDDVLQVSLFSFSVDPALRERSRKALIRNQFKATKALKKERKRLQALAITKKVVTKEVGEDWRKVYRADLSRKGKRDCKVPETDANGCRKDGRVRPRKPIKITNPKNKIRREKSKGEKDRGK